MDIERFCERFRKDFERDFWRVSRRAFRRSLKQEIIWSTYGGEVRLFYSVPEYREFRAIVELLAARFGTKGKVETVIHCLRLQIQMVHSAKPR